MNDEMREAALALAREGYRVFPLVPGDKKPLKGVNWQDKATTDPEQIARWWEQTPTANIGLRIPDVVTVIDIDVHHDGDMGMVALAGHTVRAKTGHGGYHLWFNRVELPGKPEKGVDVRQGGSGYLVMPPSVNDGGAYVWGVSPFEAEPAEMPAELVARLHGGLNAERFFRGAVSAAEPGNRNDRMCWLDRQLRDTCHLSKDDAWAYVRRFQQAVDVADDPYTEAEARASHDSIYDKEERRGPARADVFSFYGVQSNPIQSSQDKSVNQIEEEVLRWADPDLGIGSEEERAILDMCRRIDAMPSDGHVTFPNDNACKRRRAQTNYFRSVVWPHWFADCVMPSTQASTMLNLVQNEHGPGAELETLARHLFEQKANPKRGNWGGQMRRGRNGEMHESTPIPAFLATLRNALRLPPVQPVIVQAPTVDEPAHTDEQPVTEEAPLERQQEPEETMRHPVVPAPVEDPLPTLNEGPVADWVRARCAGGGGVWVELAREDFNEWNGSKVYAKDPEFAQALKAAGLTLVEGGQIVRGVHLAPAAADKQLAYESEPWSPPPPRPLPFIKDKPIRAFLLDVCDEGGWTYLPDLLEAYQAWQAEHPSAPVLKSSDTLSDALEAAGLLTSDGEVREIRLKAA
jgi:hypothetical protein